MPAFLGCFSLREVNFCMLGTEQPVHGGWHGKDLEFVIRLWIIQNFGRIALWEKSEEALVEVSLMLGRRGLRSVNLLCVGRRLLEARSRFICRFSSDL